MFPVQRNSVFLFANGSMRKIPRCNVQLCSSEEEEEQSDSDKDKESSCSPTVNFDKESFSENMTEKDIEETKDAIDDSGGEKRTRER